MKDAERVSIGKYKRTVLNPNSHANRTTALAVASPPHPPQTQKQIKNKSHR